MDGKLIAFPWNLSPAALWCNKAVMQKAGLDPAKLPQTMDELMADLAAIKKALPEVVPLGLDTTNRPFALSANWPWMQTFGADPLADGGKGADTPAMKAYLSWMRELAQKGYIEPGQKMGEFRPLAAQDKVAFTWDSVLLQGVIQSINHMPDAEFYQHWGVTKLPAGPSGTSSTFEARHDLVMFAGSAHKQAAWEFMNYLATSPNAIQNYTIKYETSLMPLKDAPSPEIAKLYDTPVFQTFIHTILPTAKTLPYGPTFAPGSTAIMAGVQQAITGTHADRADCVEHGADAGAVSLRGGFPRAGGSRGWTRWCCRRLAVLAVVIGYPVVYALVLSAEKMNLRMWCRRGSSGWAITGR